MCTPPNQLISQAQIEAIRLDVMTRRPPAGIWITAAPSEIRRCTVLTERPATRSTNCPNCGAPHGGEPVCSYCTTVF